MEHSNGVARLRKLYRHLEASRRPINAARARHLGEAEYLNARHKLELGELDVRHMRELLALYPPMEEIGLAADALEESVFNAQVSLNSGMGLTAFVVRVSGRDGTTAKAMSHWKATAKGCIGSLYSGRRKGKGSETVNCFDPLWLARTESYEEEEEEEEGEKGCLHFMDFRTTLCESDHKKSAIREHIEGLRIVGPEDGLLDYHRVQCDRDPRPGGRRDPRTEGTLYELCQRSIARLPGRSVLLKDKVLGPLLRRAPEGKEK